MGYDKVALAELREKLLERRSVLVRSSQGNQREIEALRAQGLSAEMEEGAQSASAEYVLTELSDSARKEVAQIDGALSRMDAGTYGECVECGSDIPLERLRAVPYALRDAECEGRVEARTMWDKELPSL